MRRVADRESNSGAECQDKKVIDAFLSCFPERSYRVATARLDELGVVLARLVDFDWFLLRAPQSTDHDGPVDVAMLEHHEDLIVDLGKHVGARSSPPITVAIRAQSVVSRSSSQENTSLTR